MKIFVTGGSGYLGRTLLRALRARGHHVTALARSVDAEQIVRSTGATPVRGGLEDHATLRAEASVAEAAIHLGSSRGPKTAAIDRLAAAAMQDALGSRPYIHTGGLWIYGTTDGVVAEHAPTNPPAITAWRISIERQVLTHPGHPILVMPGVVYGDDEGLVQQFLTERAHRDGYVPCIGTGSQHWPLAHVEDIAALYVRALAAPRGAVYAGVTQCEPMRSISAAIAKATGAAVRDISLEAARELMGPIAEAFSLDQRISAARARAELGWNPKHTDAIAELTQRNTTRALPE